MFFKAVNFSASFLRCENSWTKTKFNGLPVIPLGAAVTFHHICEPGCFAGVACPVPYGFN